VNNSDKIMTELIQLCCFQSVCLWSFLCDLLDMCSFESLDIRVIIAVIQTTPQFLFFAAAVFVVSCLFIRTEFHSISCSCVLICLI
jgi:hypothetical protein